MDAEEGQVSVFLPCLAAPDLPALFASSGRTEEAAFMRVNKEKRLTELNSTLKTKTERKYPEQYRKAHKRYPSPEH